MQRTYTVIPNAHTSAASVFTAMAVAERSSGAQYETVPLVVLDPLAIERVLARKRELPKSEMRACPLESITMLSCQMQVNETTKEG